MRREDPKFIEKRKKFYAEQKQKSQDKFSKGGLSPKQKVIAAKAPPPDKITGEDFAALKKEKVMKARKGMLTNRSLPTVTTAPGSMAPKAEAMKKTNGAGMNKLGKVATGKPGRIGALLTAGVVGLNMAGKKLKKVLDERKARKRDTAKVKKMGGGMMQKPMGYKEGRSISTRGGGVDSSYLGRLRDIGAKGGFRRIPTEPEGGFKVRPSRGSKKSNLKSIGKAIVAGASPITGAIFTASKIAKNLKNKNRNTANKSKSMVGTSGSKNRPTIIDKDSRNPNPKRPKLVNEMYVGGSVSVKTKLGRNKPTKLY